jgi:hypothetical protein
MKSSDQYVNVCRALMDTHGRVRARTQRLHCAEPIAPDETYEIRRGLFFAFRIGINYKSARVTMYVPMCTLYDRNMHANRSAFCMYAVHVRLSAHVGFVHMTGAPILWYWTITINTFYEERTLWFFSTSTVCEYLVSSTVISLKQCYSLKKIIFLLFNS